MSVTISSYAGSKNRTAKKYANLLKYDGIETYVEPFGGMFGVGLNKIPHPHQIYNDLNTKLAILLQTLSDRNTAYALFKLMLDLPYSAEFFLNAKRDVVKMIKAGDTGIYTAALVWYLLLTSYNGIMKQFQGIITGAEEEAFYNSILHKLPIIDKLHGLEVRNQNGIDVIKEFRDDPQTFLFVDPPYTQENDTSKNKRTSVYEHEMLKVSEQINFLRTLENAKAPILVCSYKNRLYDDILCREFGWNCVLVTETCKSMIIGRRGEMKSRAEEYAYINYTP